MFKSKSLILLAGFVLASSLAGTIRANLNTAPKLPKNPEFLKNQEVVRSGFQSPQRVLLEKAIKKCEKQISDLKDRIKEVRFSKLYDSYKNILEMRKSTLNNFIQTSSSIDSDKQIEHYEKACQIYSQALKTYPDKSSGNGTLSGNFNTTQWMEDLASYIEDKSMMDIILPGSHDAATYKITSHSNVAYDSGLKNIKDKIKWVGATSILKMIAAPLSKAQDKSIKAQLEAGSRYLDLRVSYNHKKNKYFSCHGFEGQEYDTIFREIADFLNSHSKEIVVLDFQALDNMGTGDMRKARQGDFLQKIQAAFGNKMVSRDINLNTPIKTLWASGKQVIVLYNENDPQLMHNYTWLWKRGDNVDSSWQEESNVDTLKKKLDMVQPTDLNNKFFVLQAQLSPDAKTIIKAIIAGRSMVSLQGLAAIAAQNYPLWIAQWQLSEKPVNIFMVDFLNENTAQNIIVWNMVRTKGHLAY